MELTLIFLLVGVWMGNVSGDTGYFWHVADHHYDPSYSSKQESCFQKQDPDVLGYYGDYLCDPPWVLVNNSIYAMQKTKPDPDFIIWTGDSTPHTPHHTLEDLKEIVANITNLIEDAFPGVPKFVTLGNHDFVPVHLSPPHNDSFYNWVAELWAPWLARAENISTFHKGAYYTGTVTPGIRAVVLNTNLYNSKNNLVDGTMPDPADQLAWFDNIMTKAALDNEVVHVVGHVPPGCIEDGTAKWFYPEFNKKLNDAIMKHHAIIVGAYFGHQHYDSFKVYMDENGEPLSSFFLTPSVTPWTYFSATVNGSAHNPAVRLFQYNKENGKLNDFFQYYLNLPEANKMRRLGLGEPQWELEYKATEYFNIPDVTATSLGALSNKLKIEDDVFNKYLTAYYVNASAIDNCDSACRSSHVCAIQNPDFDMYEQCYKKAVTSDACAVASVWKISLLGILILCSLI
ncbi:unnamed protein product [Owenia fusiformis]|uniref:Uncharacterized protein n=1 Tax=Owenia fusiformis TaxID=6347 RepID=A0A8J1XIP6_OWEFU|nr:unnamed protein product [Owenia fusiformis]